jgi:protein arginine kinase
MFTPDIIERVPAWFSNNGTDVDCVVSTRVRLARNLANRHFPAKASLLERKDIYEEITKAAKRVPECSECASINFSQLEKIDQQFLFENRVVSHDLINAEGDRGVICDPDSTLSIMVNEEDHIRMTCIAAGCQPARVWGLLSQLDDDLGKQVQYAFDARRGFLTSCPTNSGTGFRISFLMHLPGLVLTKTIDSVLAGASQMGISTRGFFGEHSAVVGNFFQLSNQATMGANEDEFLKTTHEVIRKIIQYERAAREKILKDAKVEIIDKIFRAYGILKYARTLETDEFLNLASALRLGIEYGMLEDITVEALNRVILLSLPAHMELYYKKKISDDEKPCVRAKIVKESLPDIAGG